ASTTSPSPRPTRRAARAQGPSPSACRTTRGDGRAETADPSSRRIDKTCTTSQGGTTLISTPRTIHWLVALSTVAALGAASLHASTNPADRARLSTLDGNRPLAFEENRGQADPRVKYLARGNGSTLFLTPSEAVLA